MSADLIELVQHLGQPHVLVVGDVMLDRYVWGDAERISQEAPVILLHADKREERLGGASSVATMLRALGARVALAGVVGTDADAGRIRQMLAELQIDHEGVVSDSGRPSTVKERYIGRAQQRHPQPFGRMSWSREPITARTRSLVPPWSNRTAAGSTWLPCVKATRPHGSCKSSERHNKNPKTKNDHRGVLAKLDW